MDFAKHLEKYLSKQEIDSLISSFDEKEHKGVYVNTRKISDERFVNLFPHVKKHPFVEHAYLYNQDEYDLGKKVYHEQGAYYIQDPSAAIVASLLPLKGNERVLDLCAAPGGKTVQASLRLGDNGILVSNDLSKPRAMTLLQNVERMGLDNVVVTSLDFSKLSSKYQNYFDAIILDAPCSGSGMFRKSEVMKNDWTYEKVIKFSEIQKQLILMAFSMLKDGGTMVYSTCSYSYEEDEEVVQYLLEKTPAILGQIPEITGNLRSKKYPETIHLFPNLFPGEGHYIALIKKPGNLTENKVIERDVLRNTTGKGQAKETQVYHLKNEIDEKLIELSLRPGLFMKTIIGKKEIPTHHYSHASMSKNSIELTKEEVIQYLSGNQIRKNNPEGYYFVSYLGMNLGLVHSVNGVLKNLYPKGLRINAKINDSF
ncbi:MAG: methyltransferase domain-containing protein [Bacilli bacterium]|nr:methyltransferase domain-containing protein [Bacilli bacterium]